MTRFVYPPIFFSSTIDPFSKKKSYKFWTRRFWKCLFSTCDNQDWDSHILQIIRHYKNILVQKNNEYYLKKGTVLYHGSTEYPFLSEHDESRMTFFGLDVIISLWYILESSYLKMDVACLTKMKKKVQYYGYLYEFRLKDDLKITTIIDKLIQNPKNSAVCKKTKSVCLHPQVSFHGVESFYRTLPNLFDLCNEVTLFYEYYKDIIGPPINIYLVDPLILHKNALSNNFDPTESIIEKINERSFAKKDISCQEYKAAFS